MATIETDERRAFERAPRAVEASGAADHGVHARLMTSNLSLGGLYCTSDADFPEMTRLAVRLVLPSRPGGRGGAESLDLQAVVVRRKKLADHKPERYELALLFTALDEDQRERLAMLLPQR